MTPDLIERATRHLAKATARGDLDAAFKWTFIIDRQLDIIARLACIDETDPRLKRYRRPIARMRSAMLAVMESPMQRSEKGG
ncbi:MAG TPA: hypothetical protein VGO52_12575 [Hyphomonadaceae bacterium]|jgi:hypothetical protein|nr:hypothetical protein [Hyphomonadaceae bacterium]